ncbi:unnamed protein product [Microthlaspi erraticum]|uniref:SKP1-like protein n=1 Tax=Microthlaspi erraticum TaxID=1685480 RepID=A0A6D2HKY4_9BRAS|nr:unnamed protein product [Microthlaspi erraticum]CAA7062376.1 unnamed protein product [Microthlaspi erraticum]
MSTLAKNIVLRSADDKIFEVEEAVALQSQTIAHMIEDDCVQNGVPLANVDGAILAIVIEYCKKHVPVVVPDGGEGDSSSSSSSSEEELKKWDADFMSQVDDPTLFSLILAANYLDIKNLLGLACDTVANMVKDRTVEEVRDFFSVTNDFTPEEEATVRGENNWGYET